MRDQARLDSRRLVGKVPHGHWRTLTFISALRADRIDAPCVFDGPVNARSFIAYVEQILAPTPRPGDIVITDNPDSHKGPPVRRAVRQAGAKLLFLPPYTRRRRRRRRPGGSGRWRSRTLPMAATAWRRC